ncbi:992555fc-5528-495e-b12a-d9aff9606c86 [Sclerotinia trifoliorum]|uniref:992555fc-5528-495e-b12a-d9aff9606c86 n=1 Tax=Sclerotinia trifoliorum TaxID=28548 RepID=A0A8H2ZUQ6_9HELO|nr:992555fc-5528-495e-b12a-d9aff9606c86 [Sclerotinia trifoliorum]
MTKKLGLQAFLRREVIKAKLQVSAENEIPSPSKKTSMSISRPITYQEPERNTFREIFGDSEEDYENPMERFRSSKTPLAVKNGVKPKTEVRLRIEELRKQLIAVIYTSFKEPSERAIIARERDRLLRSIERLEAQERREKDNARRATGSVPEPISEFEKRQQQKEIELVRKALAGEEKIKSSIKRPIRPLDDDPDGETRKMLGLPLKRRKLEKTGKWTDDLRHAIPKLRYKDYGVEELKGILLCGATEDQKEWLWKWFSRLDAKVTTGGGLRGYGKKTNL